MRLAAAFSYPNEPYNMRVSEEHTVSENVDRERVKRLEQRVARLEAHLGLRGEITPDRAEMPPPALAPVFSERQTTEEEFEFELGQHWFALAGIAILTTGVAFLLSLPHASLPLALPSVAGVALAAILVAVSHVCPRSLSQVAGYLRGAGMALLGFAALRLFFFGPQAAMDFHGVAAHGILFAVTAVNLTLGLRRRSPWLIGLAMLIGCAIAVSVGTATLVLGSIAALAIVAVMVDRRQPWPALLLLALFLIPLTYCAWASGNPFRTGAVHFVAEPRWAPEVLLALVLLMGASPLLRPHPADDPTTNVAAFLNCALGYGVYLVHTFAAFPTQFAVLNGIAAIALLGLGMAFFRRTESRVSTFFYAMTGYAALSLAILKVSSAPNVFVWLSLQSVVVVATAIWFRSRFIVVANFFIFAAIVVAYTALTKHESGISVGFGLVALVTARILNWKQHRLELKTELMRNAYLVSAFAIFPYAAYHLVSAKHVALVWIALAAAYYLLNFAVRNQKYRWMGHGTLVLATVYVVGAGVSRFEPVYRVLSFLVLGATLLTVSLLFARARRRQPANLDETK
jgi:hypothetical protein